MLLFVSTSTHCLRDYAIYHSQAIYSMGPFNQDWEHLGSVNEFYDDIGNEVSQANLYALAGPTFTEGWALSSRDGVSVDYYMRHSGQRPVHMF